MWLQTAGWKPALQIFQACQGDVNVGVGGLAIEFFEDETLLFAANGSNGLLDISSRLLIHPWRSVRNTVKLDIFRQILGRRGFGPVNRRGDFTDWALSEKFQTWFPSLYGSFGGTSSNEKSERVVLQ